MGASPREIKKTRIIEAAARVFARKGYSGTVMADIALEAGIGKGTLYEYFKSKEALFFAVFEWYVDTTGAEARVGLGALAQSAAARLELFSETLMQSWNKHKEIYSLTMEFWAAAVSSQMKARFKDAFQEGYRKYRGIIAALLHEGIARGEFRADMAVDSVAAALVGAWDALLLQAWLDEEFDPEEKAAGFLKILLAGIRAGRDGS